MRFRVRSDKWCVCSTWVRVGEANLSHLLDLLFAAPDVAVGDVRLLLHCHHGHAGVDLGGEGDLDLVLVAVHAAAQPQPNNRISTAHLLLSVVCCLMGSFR